MHTYLVDDCGTAIALLDFGFLPETSFLPAVPPPPPAAAIFRDPPPPVLVACGLPASGGQRRHFTWVCLCWVVTVVVGTTMVAVRAIQSC